MAAGVELTTILLMQIEYVLALEASQAIHTPE